MPAFLLNVAHGQTGLKSNLKLRWTYSGNKQNSIAGVKADRKKIFQEL